MILLNWIWVKFMQKAVDKYFIERNIDKLNKIGYTNFLDGKELNTIKNILNKRNITFNIYEPFKDADYKIIYKDIIPEITCFKIITNEKIKHSDIMGSLYNFDLSTDVIGDIIINDGYYFIVLSSMKEYFKDNFNTIGRYKIKLEETNIPIYERIYEALKLIVSSERIDSVISRITNLNRKFVQELIDKKDVTLNYDILTNKSYNLKPNDIFSIHRYGKYKYVGILKNTKKDNIIIYVKKYS